MTSAPNQSRRRPGRPATGQTPKRSGLRIGPVWDRVEALAKANGETMTAVVERALLAEERRLLRAVEQAPPLDA